jgi:hypothetical protein
MPKTRVNVLHGCKYFNPCVQTHAVALLVEALWYKTEGRWFECRWDNWMFSIYLILPAALGPGFTQPLIEISAKKTKIMFFRSRVSRCVGLTILQPSVSRLSRQYRILSNSQPCRPPRPVTGIASLYGDEVCFLWGTNWTVSTATSSQYLAVNCEPIV